VARELIGVLKPWQVRRLRSKAKQHGKTIAVGPKHGMTQPPDTRADQFHYWKLPTQATLSSVGSGQSASLNYYPKAGVDGRQPRNIENKGTCYNYRALADRRSSARRELSQPLASLVLTTPPGDEARSTNTHCSSSRVNLEAARTRRQYPAARVDDLEREIRWWPRDRQSVSPHMSRLVRRRGRTADS
jgi:hypothetical protein